MMQLTFEDNGIIKEKDVKGISDIEEVLAKLDPSTFPYVILTNDTKDFIQCAGSVERLAVEVRFYSGASFKHYLIGKLEMSKVWCTIDCKVGPITVLGHEVLNVKNAIELFQFFYLKQEIAPNYNKRNITKQFN